MARTNWGWFRMAGDSWGWLGMAWDGSDGREWLGMAEAVLGRMEMAGDG